MCIAHVGDQFGQSNAHLLAKVFGWFYISINVGAAASTLLTLAIGMVRTALGFWDSGVLMAIATLLFWMGRKVFVHIPARGADLSRVFSKEV